MKTNKNITAQSAAILTSLSLMASCSVTARGAPGGGFQPATAQEPTTTLPQVAAD